MDATNTSTPTDTAYNLKTKAQLLDAFYALLPTDAVLHDTEDLKPFECDGLSAYRRVPMIALLPDSIDQVQEIMRICHKAGVPVVARGAGTGLSGGALPPDDGVLLSLSKFKNILDIDVDNRRATVQPGVRNLAISEAAAPYGLYYAPDPSSQIACSIGGNVAENSGGIHCLKYGLTTNNIVQLEVVTMDGERMTIGGAGLDAPGYDLLALLTGSEGLLGVIVQVVVKLLPKPDLARVVLAAFDDVNKAGDAVAAIIAAGIVPAGLEMLDNPAIRATEDFVHANYPTDAAAILLCEVDGPEAEVDADLASVVEVVETGGASEVRVSSDENERALFWAGRRAAFPAMGRISPDYYCMDGTIPRGALAEVLQGIYDLSEQYGQRVANVFHAGDGNLHPLILYDANIDGELERTEAFGGAICELCLKHGGTITGEHGVGVEKIDYMCTQFSEQELAQFHAVKAAFDPSGLLNPGKAVPTLHRCAEFGAMHVHDGQLPFPTLERF